MVIRTAPVQYESSILELLSDLVHVWYNYVRTYKLIYWNHYVTNSLRPTDEILLRGCPLNCIL